MSTTIQEALAKSGVASEPEIERFNKIKRYHDRKPEPPAWWIEFKKAQEESGNDIQFPQLDNPH